MYCFIWSIRRHDATVLDMSGMETQLSFLFINGDITRPAIFLGDQVSVACLTVQCPPIMEPNFNATADSTDPGCSFICRRTLSPPTFTLKPRMLAFGRCRSRLEPPEEPKTERTDLSVLASRSVTITLCLFHVLSSRPCVRNHQLL